MNQNLRIGVGTVIVIAIFTIPFCLLQKDAILTTAYIFTLAGILSVSGSLFWTNNRREHEEYVLMWHFSFAALKYFAAGLLLSAFVLLLKFTNIYTLPAIWFFFLHFVIAGIFFIKVLVLDAGKAKIESVGAEVRQRTSNWKSLTGKVAALVSMASSPEIRKEVNSVQEALRYADPMTNDALEEIESSIAARITLLSGSVQSNDLTEVRNLCRQLLTDIQIRNQQCKSLK